MRHNNVEKCVISGTMTEPGWQHRTVLSLRFVDRRPFSSGIVPTRYSGNG